MSYISYCFYTKANAPLDQGLLLFRSELGKATNYAHKRWPKRIARVDGGLLRMDNNLTENAIRPFVVGRKNFLFFDTVAGSNASARLYRLIDTARAYGI